MDKERLDYLSYLLRLWRVENHEGTTGTKKVTWRASLESAHTGERMAFANLDDLFEFLRKQTDVPSDR